MLTKLEVEAELTGEQLCLGKAEEEEGQPCLCSGVFPALGPTCFLPLECSRILCILTGLRHFYLRAFQTFFLIHRKKDVAHYSSVPTSVTEETILTVIVFGALKFSVFIPLNPTHTYRLVATH